MTATTLTLTDFLLARIAEDEDVARAATSGPWVTYAPRKTYIESMAPGLRFPTVLMQVMPMGTDVDAAHVARHDPARVLAECEAKRRIVELWALDMSEPYDDEPAMPLGGQGAEVFYDVLRALALPYADHPDYREEWKP